MASESAVNSRYFSVSGLKCHSCAINLEKALQKDPCVQSASVSFFTEMAVVDVTEGFDPSVLTSQIGKTGYLLYPVGEQNQQGQRKSTMRHMLIELAIVTCFGMWCVMFSLILHFTGQQLEQSAAMSLAVIAGLLALPVLLYSGPHYLAMAYRSLLSGVVGMDLLVVIGVFSAVLLSVYNMLLGNPSVYFDTACMLLLFQHIARLVDYQHQKKYQHLLAELVDAIPRHCLRLNTDDETEAVQLSQLNVGDRVFIPPFKAILVDGVIESGHGEIDVASLTGEPLPRVVGVGDQVQGGTWNRDFALVVRVTSSKQKNFLVQLEQRLKQALTMKSSAHKLIDRAAQAITPVAILVSIIYGVVSYSLGNHAVEAVSQALCVILISCPCSLALLTPLIQARIMKVANAIGFKVMRPNDLIRFRPFHHYFIDKTGTLTTGEPKVVRVNTQMNRDRLASIVLGLEQHIQHPVASSLCAWAKAQKSGVSPAAIKQHCYRIGEGVSGQYEGEAYFLGAVKCLDTHQSNRQPNCQSSDNREFETHIQLVQNNNCVAQFLLQETLRPEAKEFLKSLEKVGSVTILSGDRSARVEYIARQLELPAVQAVGELSAFDKANILAKTRKECVMLGDGINDALALSSAGLGISLSNNSYVSIAASAVSKTPNLRCVSNLLRLTARARQSLLKSSVIVIIYYIILLGLNAYKPLSPNIALLGPLVLTAVLYFNNSLVLREESID